MKTRKDANSEAHKMRLAMPNPKEWEPEVWENMGWHAAIVNEHVRIYSHPEYGKMFKRLRYGAMVTVRPNEVGGGPWAYMRGHASTPLAAAKDAIRAFNEYYAAKTEIHESIADSLKKVSVK